MGDKKKSKQDTAELGVNEAASILPTSRSRPIFDASGRGPCHAVLTYEACLRLCINSSNHGRKMEEASYFLKGEFSELRKAFGLNQVLLRSQEEQLRKKPSEIASEAAAPKSKKSVGKMKVRVGEVKMQCSSSRARGEKYDCSLKLKSSSEEDVMSMQPGSSPTYVFLHVDRSDKLIVEVHNSKEQYCGEVLAPVNSVADKPSKMLEWWSLHREPEHKLVGKIQLSINYSTSQEENNIKCGSTIAESVAYDFLLEVAMKAQQFQRRNLLLAGPWKWLVKEFASYYGVSDAYAKLRYLSYVMQVATPTEDCLKLICRYLTSVKRNIHRSKEQHKRLLREIEDQVRQILTWIFKNYKSLDESSPTGVLDDPKAAIGSPPPALSPAVKLYRLLHDISSPETQQKFIQYFQTAAKKRSTRQLAETYEFINNKGASFSTSYPKMGLLISSIRKEIHTDKKIHNQNILPSFVDLPNLSARIYGWDLYNRLKEFLAACPPCGPSPPVIELVIATADFQKKLSSWKIDPVNSVDVKVLFYSDLTSWIGEERHSLLKEHSGIITQQMIDEMYEQLKKTLKKYKRIISHWPEFNTNLENVIADVEKEISEALKRQYADVLAPLKDNRGYRANMLCKIVPKFSKETAGTYNVPDELGVLLNSMDKILNELHPGIESQFKSCGGNTATTEHLDDIRKRLSTDLRNYTEAIRKKLPENTRGQCAKILKKVIKDSKRTGVEPDVRGQMQPLQNGLIVTIKKLHSVFEPRVFKFVCQSFWEGMGQDVLHFLEKRTEKISKGCSTHLQNAISILGETFISQMRNLPRNALSEEDLKPPHSVMKVRSMLAKF